MSNLLRRILAVLLLTVLVTATPAVAQPPPAGRAAHGLDLAGMDPSVKPGDDLYQAANGAWLASTTIPGDQPEWSDFTALAQQNLAVLRTVAEEAARDRNAPGKSATRQVGDFYASGMDTRRIEKEDLRPLAPELALIRRIHDRRSLEAAIGRLHREMVFPAFWSGARPDPNDSEQMLFWLGAGRFGEGGLGLPDRDYYLQDNPKMAAIRREYVAHVGRMLVLLGDPPERARGEARSIMAMETRLARVALDKVVRRDPGATTHVLTAPQVDALTPGVSWEPYWRAVGLRRPDRINVTNPAFMREVGQMQATLPLADWKAYLRWQLIHATAFALSSLFVNEDFHFNQTVLRGVAEIEPRWKRALHAIDSPTGFPALQQMTGGIGEALGQLYVAKAFPPSSKARVEAMVGNIRDVLRERLQSLDWMSEPTRRQAVRKLDRMVAKIGYPDHWRDYSRLGIDRHSYFGNLRRAAEFEYQRGLDQIGRPRDRSEWNMTPPTVNAMYDPTRNDITLPAGVLQPPIFDAQADDAVNYGRIGWVISHEITHAFDDEGRRFDAEGNLKDWWTPADAASYKARGAAIVKQYNDYVAIDGLHVNGAHTLGENIADIGGLKLAWLAFRKSLHGKPHPADLDGYTPEQRFFLALAQLCREQMRPAAARMQIEVDPHSPLRFRVLGPVSLMPEFYSAFGRPVPEWVTDRQKEAIW